MSGLGRAIADLELRNAATMRAAQERWDNMAPPDTDAYNETAGELEACIDCCEQLIGRAQRAIERGEFEQARDLLTEAGRDLAEAVQEVEL